VGSGEWGVGSREWGVGSGELKSTYMRFRAKDLLEDGRQSERNRTWRITSVPCLNFDM
jgi:hypothetical protein